jgi:hypothetical protein
MMPPWIPVSVFIKAVDRGKKFIAVAEDWVPTLMAARGAQPELLKIVAATLTGMTTEQFQADVKNWLATAKDHRWKRPYTELTYQPMQEVLKYLRANLRRGEEGWLVGHQHEERLEAYFCFRELTRIMCTRESKILLGRAAGL